MSYILRPVQLQHSLRRTSPKGQKFFGRCVLCGATDLPAKAALEPCPNPRGVTSDEALVSAIEGTEP